jgi:hypothetical protein
MRFLVKISIPVEIGNAKVKDGTLAKTIQSILNEQKPEASYWTDVWGKRGGYVIMNFNDAADIPRIAEPWFLSLNATVEFKPVMTPEDLGKAALGFDTAVKQYGS